MFLKMLITLKLKNVMIYIGKMLRLSFHMLGKISHKMSQMFREFFSLVREKVREYLETFFIRRIVK